MDWEWSKPVAGTIEARDWFVIKVRRSDRYPEDLRCSLTFVDRPHGGEETSTREVLPTLDAVFEITGPLAKDLRAEGWEKVPSGALPHSQV